MPIYEYICEEGHEFEDLLPMGADPPKCPKCGGKTKKKVSRASFDGMLFSREMDRERERIARDLK